MEELTANEAKTQFGDMLLKVQRSPIQINKNGKPVAVVIAMDDYINIEAFKVRLLKAKVQRANTDIETGATVDGEVFFDELLDSLHD